jgi:hypothetical protein
MANGVVFGQISSDDVEWFVVPQFVGSRALSLLPALVPMIRFRPCKALPEKSAYVCHHSQPQLDISPRPSPGPSLALSLFFVLYICAGSLSLKHTKTTTTTKQAANPLKTVDV